MKVVCLKDLDIFVVDKVVTKGEADQIVKAAEAKGFQHQGSRGPAHGEVCSTACILLTCKLFLIIMHTLRVPIKSVYTVKPIPYADHTDPRIVTGNSG